MTKQGNFSFYVILINLAIKSHTWPVAILLSSTDPRLSVPLGLFPYDPITFCEVSLKEPHLETAMLGTKVEHFVSPPGLGQGIQGD